jgi:hypothetical protein
VQRVKSQTAWLPLTAALLMIAISAWTVGDHAWLFRRVAGSCAFPDGTKSMYFSDGTVSLISNAGDNP